MPAASSGTSRDDTVVLGRSRRDSESVENSGCSCESSPGNECVSLQQAVFNFQSMHFFLNSDHPYTFFSLGDLHYSGILGHQDIDFLAPPSNDTDITTTFELENTEGRCSDLKQRFIFPSKAETKCAWHYECHQHQHQFPSFHFSAVLNDKNADCEDSEVRIEDWRFMKTPCEHDSSLSHWQKCNCGPKVVAYT